MYHASQVLLMHAQQVARLPYSEGKAHEQEILQRRALGENHTLEDVLETIYEKVKWFTHASLP